MDFSKMSDKDLAAFIAEGDKKKETVGEKVDFSQMPDKDLAAFVAEREGTTPPAPAIDRPAIESMEHYRGLETPPSWDTYNEKDLLRAEPERLENLEATVEVLSDAGKGGSRGAARLPLGIARLVEETVNLLPNVDSEVVKGWIADNEEYIKANGLELEATGGEIVANIIAGIYTGGVTAPLKVAVVEGGVEGFISAGSGDEPSEIASRAITALVGTYAVSKPLSMIINHLKPVDLQKTYAHLLDQYDVDKKIADEDFLNWQRVKHGSDNVRNRIIALVDNLGKEGAAVKYGASVDAGAVKNMNKSMHATKKTIRDLAKGDFDLMSFADDLQLQYDRVGKQYGAVKNMLQDKPVKETFEKVMWAALDDATKSNVHSLTRLIGKEADEITVKNLVDASPLVNDMIRRTSGPTLGMWKQVKKKLETSLKSNLSKPEYNMWRVANDNYSDMAQTRVSALGDLIGSSKGTTWKGTAKRTPEEVMRKIKTVAGGDDIFSNIVGLVGKEQAANLEKAMIKETIGGRLGKDSWETISKNLSVDGFVTPEGKRLKELIKLVSETFMTDDAVRVLNTKAGTEGATIATTIQGKIQVGLIQKLHAMWRRHDPFNEVTSKHLLHMDEVYDVLKDPVKTKKFIGSIEDLAPGIKASISKQIQSVPEKPTEFVKYTPK